MRVLLRSADFRPARATADDAISGIDEDEDEEEQWDDSSTDEADHAQASHHSDPDSDSESSFLHQYGWNALGGLSPVIGVGAQHLSQGDARDATRRLALAVEFRGRIHVESN